MDSITVHVQNSEFSLGISIPNPSYNTHRFKQHNVSPNTRCGDMSQGYSYGHNDNVNGLNIVKPGNFPFSNAKKSLLHKGSFTANNKGRNSGRDQPELHDTQHEIYACDPSGKKRTDDFEELNSVSTQRSQMSSTLNWLTDNYERADGVCLPRCVLYAHYLDFCKRKDFSPVGAATFGKIIRQRFPKLTTRRLGTRGQSKYHYYGIGIKESSIYYHSVYTGKGLTRFSGTKVKTEGSSRKYSLSAKTGTLLPDFPHVTSLLLPKHLSRDKVETFLMMYRTHCQRILDTVISANFDEVQSFLLHFWQGMPSHLMSLLHEDIITELVAFCDSILYKVLSDVLIPSSIQDLPDSLNTDIRIFLKSLPIWLENSLEDLPIEIQRKKTQAVKLFIQSIKRQMAFVQLAQTSRVVLMNQDSVSQMIEDLGQIDIEKVVAQAAIAAPTIQTENTETFQQYFKEFKYLLSSQTQIESITEWLDNIADTHVLQNCQSDFENFKKIASSFLLLWSLFSSLILKDLTLNNAASFGALHLIRMMFDEYVLLIMETHHQKLSQGDQYKLLQKYFQPTGCTNTKSADVTDTQKANMASPEAKIRKSFSDDSSGSERYFQVANENSSDGRSDPAGYPVHKVSAPTQTETTGHGTGAILRHSNLSKTTIHGAFHKLPNALHSTLQKSNNHTCSRINANTDPLSHITFHADCQNDNRDWELSRRHYDSKVLYQPSPANFYDGPDTAGTRYWNNTLAQYSHSTAEQFYSPYSYHGYSACDRQPSFQQTRAHFYGPAAMPDPQIHVTYGRSNYMDLASSAEQYDAPHRVHHNQAEFFSSNTPTIPAMMSHAYYRS